MNKFKEYSIIVVAFIFGFLGAHTASLVSAHGGDTNLIHACVKSNGQIRIVDANEECRNNESSLDWNIQGEPGPSGGGLPFFICGGCDLGGVGNRLTGRDLTDAFLTGASLSGVDLSDTRLDGADLRGTDLRESNLINASLVNADLSMDLLGGANLTNADFSGTNLTATNFSYDASAPADLTNTNLTNANLTEANLADVNLTSANLTGVTWLNTTCPDSTNSNDNGNTCIGHLVP